MCQGNGADAMDFTRLAEAIRHIHEDMAVQARRAVNVSLTLRNWLIRSAGGGRKLAANLGVSPQQWSQWLGGKRFPLKEQRAKIAWYFGINETELLLGSLKKSVAQEKGERNRAPMLQATGDRRLIGADKTFVRHAA